VRIGFEALLDGRALAYAVDIPQPADRQMRFPATSLGHTTAIGDGLKAG
jgi:hypothetical protein